MKKSIVDLEEAIQGAKNYSPYGQYSSFWNALRNGAKWTGPIYFLNKILDESPFKDEVSYAILHELKEGKRIKMYSKGHNVIIEVIAEFEDEGMVNKPR